MSKFKLNQEVFYMCANMPTIGKIVGIAVIVKGDFPIIPKALQPERCVQEKIIYNIGEIYPILVNESQIFATKEDLRYSLFANL